MNISLKEEEEEDEEEEKDDGKDLQVLLDEANFQASGANIFDGSATDLNLSQKIMDIVQRQNTDPLKLAISRQQGISTVIVQRWHNHWKKTLIL